MTSPRPGPKAPQGAVRQRAGVARPPRPHESRKDARCENAAVTLHLSEADVERLLSPADAVEAIEGCFRRMAAGAVENRPRYRLRLHEGALAVMAASDLELGYAGAKVYAGFRGGARFEVLLFRADAPELVATIEADRLGQLRTGAASAVAARYLARAGAASLGLIGCGRQAESQLACIRAARAVARAGRRLLPDARAVARLLRAHGRRAGREPPRSRGLRRRRHRHDLARSRPPRRVAAAGSARLRGGRERRPPARARQRRPRAGRLRLLRLGRGREARVRRPDRAGRGRRPRLARGARAAGGRLGGAARAGSRTRTSSSSSRTASPRGTSPPRRRSWSGRASRATPRPRRGSAWPRRDRPSRRRGSRPRARAAVPAAAA